MTEPTIAPSICEQADEVELQFVALRDLYERSAAGSGRVRRSPEAIERLRTRVLAAQAASVTLRQLAERGSP